MPTIFADSIDAAVAQLRQSDAGYQALLALSEMLSGPALDSRSQQAVVTLLLAAHGPLAGTCYQY